MSQLLWKSNSLNGGCLQVGFPMKSFSIVPSTHTWCVMISDQCYCYCCCCSIPSSPQFILFRVECQLRTIRRAKWIAQFQTSWCWCCRANHKFKLKIRNKIYYTWVHNFILLAEAFEKDIGSMCLVTSV